MPTLDANDTAKNAKRQSDATTDETERNGENGSTWQLTVSS